MARERLSGGSASFQNVPPPSYNKATPKSSSATSRLPIPVKPRAVLGERVENFDHATPRQHVVKHVKSVSRVKLTTQTKSKSPVRLQATAQATKSKSPTRLLSSTQAAKPKSPSRAQTSTRHLSSPGSTMATPAGANVSRPGHTPHPRRSSVGLGQLMMAGDETMLMDMTGRDFLISDSEASEADEDVPARERPSGRGVLGAGRMMTPENSQETRHRPVQKDTSPSRRRTRFPTPPSSQADPVSLPSITQSLVRARPAPTPPRAAPASRLNQSLAPSQNPSPNPRRRKSPRVDGEETPRLRSPFDPVDASMNVSPQPRDRVEIVLGGPRRSTEKSPAAATTSMTGGSKGRKSVAKTPKPAALSKSTSTKSRAPLSKPPATAPPAQRQRRKSTPRTSVGKKSSPRQSLSKSKSKASRASLPASRSSRKSVTPAELKAMVGIMPVPIEQGSPSEDPLLLVADDETSWGTPSASACSQPRARPTNKASSSRMARVIDFDALRAQIPPSQLAGALEGEEGASGSGTGAGFYDFQVPLAGSEPDYDHNDEPMWGNESDVGSDMDVGNDTFIHVTGARSPVMIGERNRVEVQAPTAVEEDWSGSVIHPLDDDDESGDVTIQARSFPPPVEEAMGETVADNMMPVASPSAFDESLDIVEEGSNTLAESPVRSERHTSVVSDLIHPQMDNDHASPTPSTRSDSVRSPARSVVDSSVAESPVPKHMTSPSHQARVEEVESTTPVYSPVKLNVESASQRSTPVRTSGSPILSPVNSIARSSYASPARRSRLGSLRPSSPAQQVGQQTSVEEDGIGSTTPLWSPPNLSTRVASPTLSRFGTPSTSSRAASPAQPSLRAGSATLNSPISAVGALGLFLHHEQAEPQDDQKIDETPEDDEDGTVVDDGLAEYDESLAAPVVDFDFHGSEVHNSEFNDEVHDEDPAETLEPASTTPIAPLPSLMEVMNSPRVPKSPLPDLADDLDDEQDADAETKTEVEVEVPAQGITSTTPTAPLPSQLGLGLGLSPSTYPLAFSPRYASPLRTVQARLPSPARSIATPAPAISAIPGSITGGESTVEELEFEECPSADVTFEGNSADWSSSDDEHLENDDAESNQEESDVVELDTELETDQIREEAEPSTITTKLDESVNSQDVMSESEEKSFEPDMDSHDVTLDGDSEDWELSEGDIPPPASEALEVEPTVTTDTTVNERIDDEAQDQGLQEGECSILDHPELSADVLQDQSGPENQEDSSYADDSLAADTTLEESNSFESQSESSSPDEQLDNDNAQSHLEQEQDTRDSMVPPSNDQPDFEEHPTLPKDPEDSLLADSTVEESNSFESDSGTDTDTESNEQSFNQDSEPSEPQDEGAETYQDQSQEEEVQNSPKIVLKVRNIGTVKIEPEEQDHSGSRAWAPPTPAMTARSVSHYQATEGEDGERSTTPAYDPPTSTSTFVHHPASPAQSSVPQIALTVSHAPSPAPRHSTSSTTSDTALAHDVDQTARSMSTRPRSRSRLSRQPTEVGDEEDTSIRVRSRPSLGDELLRADESMRSVVEVSSLDPKAAARAAAILKMNHRYIENGDLTTLDRSKRTPTPGPSTYLDRSKHVDKTELLYEAELEIVSTRRSRSRSMSRFRGVSEAPTDLALPGGWNGTPKRKRQIETAHAHVEAPTTRGWGVSDWKTLEKVFRAERELWKHEREIKQMPGGFLGWARMSTFGSPAPVIKVWDPIRVVDRFCTEQGIKADQQIGDYSVDMLKTRVEALERHAEYRKSNPTQSQTDEQSRSPKKSKIVTDTRTETPVKKMIKSPIGPPPSGIRRMFNWAIPTSTPKSKVSQASQVSRIPISQESQVTPSKSDSKGKGKATDLDIDDPVEDSINMSQVGSRVVSHGSISHGLQKSTSATSTQALPQHPSSPVWRSARPAIPSLPTAHATTTTRSHLSSSSMCPTPNTLSAILAASSSSTSSMSLGSSTRETGIGKLYPSLQPSMSQRSTALNALFTPGAKSSESIKTVAMPIKRSTSVKDLVQSFEDSGVLDKSLNKTRPI